MSLRILFFALALAACGSGDASGDGCHRDEDCVNGGACIAGACVTLTNPLDAALPDLSDTDSSLAD